MAKIYVDGDACPVKDEAIKVAMRHGRPIHFIANQWLRLPKHELIHMQLAPQGPDEADNMIVDLINAGDICITSDIPLADRCIKKDAHVLTPTGKTLTPDCIGMALATRDLMTDLRDTGQIEGGGSGKAFSKADRSNFLNALEVMVRKTS